MNGRSPAAGHLARVVAILFVLGCAERSAFGGQPFPDRCFDANWFEIGKPVQGTTIGATQFADEFFGCEGQSPGGNGVWYRVLGDGSEMTLTFECESGDHQLFVLCDDNCAHPMCMASPITCGRSVTWCTRNYASSLILVRSLTTPGNFTLSLQSGYDESRLDGSTRCSPAPTCASWPPSHDHCFHFNDFWPGTTILGTTVGASYAGDEFAGCDGRTPGGNGVWFSANSDGTTLTAKLECESRDMELLVFCDDCDNPLCVAPPARCGESTSWCSWSNDLILVRSPTTPGDFKLTVESSGEYCESDRVCGNGPGVDTCSRAGPIPLDPAIHGSTWGANDEGDQACGPSPGGSIWLKHVGDGTRLTASICSVPAETPVHTLSVMCNTCDVPRCLSGGFVTSDCSAGLQEISWCSKSGDTYFLRIDGPLLSSAGDFELSLTSDGQPCAPVHDCSASNDTCDSAQPLALGESVPVSTYGASADGTPYCYGYDTWPGLWYDVVGDGTVLEASLCNVFANNPMVRVYCGDCELPACVTTDYSEYNVNYDICEGYEIKAYRWCSEPGNAYHVHPIDSSSNPDEWFSLDVKSTGIPCADFNDCLYDPPPPNDRCADATVITGEGTFPFENTYATPEEPFDMCHFTGTNPPTHDVWYCWTSACDGPVTVETCGGTTVDTQLAVYDHCACNNLLMQCNNDACGYQSRVSFNAVKGQTYGIQVGTLISLGGGNGEFRIICEPPPPPLPCGQFSPGECASRSRDDALNSTRGQFVMAENMWVDDPDSFYRVCWWGADHDGEGPCRREEPDDFQITYYADDCGRPGAIVGGPFSQAAGTLIVTGPVRTSHNIKGSVPELEYSATHDFVSVGVGQYWIEITNSASGSCSWFWETAPLADPRSYRTTGAESTTAAATPVRTDAAFLMEACYQSQYGRAYDPSCYPPPANDEWYEPRIISVGEPIEFDTTGATTDFALPQWLYDFPLGDQRVHKDMWFRIDPECTGPLTVDICDADFDVKAVFYKSYPVTPGLVPVASNDDACGPERGLQSWLTANVEADFPYHYDLQVGGYRGDFGRGTIEASYAAPEVANLRVFAAFANCVSPVCEAGPCQPPRFSNPCCVTQDFDADGDVDLEDYDFLRLRWSDP